MTETVEGVAYRGVASMLEIAVDGTLLDRLAAQFPALDRRTVHRCVRDTCACAEHLGLDVTPALVEALVREHLTAQQKGAVKPLTGGR